MLSEGDWEYDECSAIHNQQSTIHNSLSSPRVADICEV